jgi:hypothetical protein
MLGPMLLVAHEVLGKFWGYLAGSALNGYRNLPFSAGLELTAPRAIPIKRPEAALPVTAGRFCLFGTQQSDNPSEARRGARVAKGDGL